jgi:hypothetical protein
MQTNQSIENNTRMETNISMSGQAGSVFNIIGNQPFPHHSSIKTIKKKKDKKFIITTKGQLVDKWNKGKVFTREEKLALGKINLPHKHLDCKHCGTCLICTDSFGIDRDVKDVCEQCIDWAYESDDDENLIFNEEKFKTETEIDRNVNVEIPKEE